MYKSMCGKSYKTFKNAHIENNRCFFEGDSLET